MSKHDEMLTEIEALKADIDKALAGLRAEAEARIKAEDRNAKLLTALRHIEQMAERRSGIMEHVRSIARAAIV